MNPQINYQIPGNKFNSFIATPVINNQIKYFISTLIITPYLLLVNVNQEVRINNLFSNLHTPFTPIVYRDKGGMRNNEPLAPRVTNNLLYC